MAFRNLNTYDGWKTEGRIVAPGEKAEQYHRALGGQLTAVWRLDQTVEICVEDLSVGDFITAEDKEVTAAAKAKKANRIKLRIKAPNDAGNFPIHIWCGNSKATIERLKKNGYRYVGSIHRWAAVRDNPDDVVTSFRKMGYEVEVDDERGI